jgi:hypothetical protein
MGLEQTLFPCRWSQSCPRRFSLFSMSEPDEFGRTLDDCDVFTYAQYPAFSPRWLRLSLLPFRFPEQCRSCKFANNERVLTRGCG